MNETLLNMIPNSCAPEVHLSQYDNGRVLRFVLKEGNAEYQAPSGAVVKVKATKPSGLGFIVSGTISDGNIVTVTNTETMTNEAGRFPAELSITSGSTLLGTSNFVFNIERSPHPEGTIDGDAETLLPELTLLVERIENSNARIESMTASATPLPSGQNPTANYNETTNTLELGIPVADRQYITVDGVDYPINSITKVVRDEIEGIEVEYGTGQTIFIFDSIGMNAVATMIQAQLDGKVSAVKLNGDILIPHYDSSFGNGVVDLGTISDDTKADAIVKTASGSIASFSDGGDELPMKSLKVNIVPKQSGSGDPSPSNVRPISGWDAVDVLHTGKNLLSSNATIVNGYVSTDGIIPESATDRTAIIPVAPNTTYTWRWNRVAISGGDDSALIIFNEYPVVGVTSGEFQGVYITQTGGTQTFTTKSSTRWLGIKIGNIDRTNISDTIANSQLEVGTTATTYEPYEGETITTQLPQTVYGGTVDIIEGNGQPTYLYKEMTGNESALQELGDYYGWVDGTQFPYCKESSPQYGECSHFRYGIDTLVGVNASSGAYFLIKKSAMSNISSLTEFRNWVIQQYNNGTPLTIAYELATPTATEITLTPTEVKTKLGSNNVWSESGTVEVEYRADTTLAYNELLNLIANM